jgi:hypothetical protein
MLIGGPLPGWWGRRRSRVNVEDQATAAQPERQRHHQRRLVELRRERGPEDRRPGQDAEPAARGAPPALILIDDAGRRPG